jgi:hypothetical protein
MMQGWFDANKHAQAIWIVAHEFGYTLDEISKLSYLQLVFLLTGLKKFKLG